MVELKNSSEFSPASVSKPSPPSIQSSPSLPSRKSPPSAAEDEVVAGAAEDLLAVRTGDDEVLALVAEQQRQAAPPWMTSLPSLPCRMSVADIGAGVGDDVVAVAAVTFRRRSRLRWCRCRRCPRPHRRRRRRSRMSLPSVPPMTTCSLPLNFRYAAIGSIVPSPSTSTVLVVPHDLGMIAWRIGSSCVGIGARSQLPSTESISRMGLACRRSRRAVRGIRIAKVGVAHHQFGERSCSRAR